MERLHLVTEYNTERGLTSETTPAALTAETAIYNEDFLRFAIMRINNIIETFKTENEANTKELKATKEMNFTLARKINTGPKEDPETTLYNFMKGFKN